MVAFSTEPIALLTLIADGYGEAIAWSLMTIVRAVRVARRQRAELEPNTAVPILVVPSFRAKVATISWPLVPAAVNVNGLETE